MIKNPFYDPESAIRDLEDFHGIPQPAPLTQDQLKQAKLPLKAKWTEEFEQDFQAFHGARGETCTSS